MSEPLPAALLTEVLERLRCQWGQYFPGEPNPRSLGYVLQGTGVGKLIVFVLANGRGRPRCIVKVPRSARDNDSLAHEHWLVCELARRSGEVGAASLPLPLAAPVVQGRQIVVERMLPGRLFSSVVPSGGQPNLALAGQHLRQVQDWLVSLHRVAFPAPEPLTEQAIERFFIAPIREAQARAELRRYELRFLDGLCSLARSLLGQRFPLSFSHGDLRPGNILIHQGRLRVLDWQLGQMPALPLLDWFEFGYRYYADSIGLAEITGDHDAYRAAFADVFLGAHPYSQLMRAQTQACAEALGVPADALDLLLAMWLVDNTNKYLTFLGDRAEHGYLYLMANPPGGPFQSFRQQLKRQVYPSLLGQLSQSRGALAPARPQPNSAWPVGYPAG